MQLSSSPLAFRPRFLVQLAVVSVVLITLWLTFDSSSPSSTPTSHSPFTSSSSSHSNPIVLEARPGKSRKVESDTASPPWKFARPKEELKPCEKIFLFSFVPWWGFASEFILYIRAKAMADKLGYTFLADDSSWNYGRLSDYFEPSVLSCVPPTDWNDYRKAYPIYQGKSWRYDKKGRPRKRLRYSRAFLSNLDDLTRETYFEGDNNAESELVTLRENDEGHRLKKDRWILEEGGTLPRVFEGVFRDHSAAVQDTWKLNQEMQEVVEELKGRTALGEMKRVEGSNSGRGPVIGLHIRLGDKSTEYVHDSQEMGITNQFGNLTAYIEAAHDAYRRLVSSDYPPLSDSSTPAPRFSPHARPTLLVMTAEPGVADRLASIPLAKPFKIIQTPAALQSKDAGEGSRRLRELELERLKQGADGSGPKAYAGSSDDPAILSTFNSTDPRDGYTQSTFNSRPLEERIEHTKAFVRDLALLTSEEVDALVVSGASNIGRLAMLIGGPQAVIGPRDSKGRALGGKIRSIDAHFYPTSYPSSVYARYTDVEDLDNAAFLPDEQLHRKKQPQKRRMSHE